jgi:hypothetical protein
MKLIHQLAFAALLVGTGCATAPDIQTRSDASVRYDSYRTFAILPVATVASLSPATASAVLEAAQTGARDALRTMGYTETTRENADLVFYLHGKVMAPVDIRAWNYAPESKFGTGSATNHIFVETYDNHSKRQVWMGSIECPCTKVDPERIQNEINRILATFPPRSMNITLSSASQDWRTVTVTHGESVD